MRIVIAVALSMCAIFMSGTPVLAETTGVTSEAAAACAGLLTPAMVQQAQSVQMAYAYDQLTTSSNSQNEASNGSANYFDIGAAGGQSYSTERKRADQIGLHWKLADSSSYAANFIPANQSTDYLSCIKNIEQSTDGGVGVKLDDNINNTPHFTFVVRGTTFNAQRKLVIWTNGKPLGNWPHTFGSGPSSAQISVSWPDPNQPLVIRAQMKQVNGGLIGTETKYVLWPEIHERIEHHVSPSAEVRHPNQSPACDCKSSAITVTAAADEVLIGSSLKLPQGEWLHKTWGKKDFPCSSENVVMNSSSDASLATGYVVCSVGFYADENPGYKAHFEVDGVHMVIPKPNPAILMVEKEFP